MYIDIHSHHTIRPPETVRVVSLYDNFSRVHELEACSAGLHPWYLDEIETRWQLLQDVASLPNVIAIGECGLDKVTATDWSLQLDAFARQIELAKQLAKPLIIHCVRVYEEVMHLLNKHKISVPVIFHGFNKSPELAAQLTSHGYYLSFGAALMKGGQPAATFKSVPPHHMFLETDDAPEDIKDIYRMAALVRETTEEALILQLQQNFKTAFNQ
jgi:TatD DNase family protein